MGINAPENFVGSMAGTRLDIFIRVSFCMKHGCTGMPEIVEAIMRDAIVPKQPLEAAVNTYAGPVGNISAGYNCIYDFPGHGQYTV